MKRILLLGLLILSVAGCSRLQGAAGALGVGSGNAKRATAEIDGTRYHARAHPDSDDKRLFAVTSSPIGANPDGAKEAGRYSATRYCLLTYGGSDTEWISGPDLPLQDLEVDGDTLTMRGRCTQR